jgi:hypothetical protein
MMLELFQLVNPETYLIRKGSLRGGFAPSLKKSPPPLLEKERGIQGVRF